MFRECLQTIADRCPGLLGASLVGRDGLPIDSLILVDTHDVEMLSAELVALAQAARENHREFGGGPLRSLAVETERYVLLLGEAAEDVYLLLFLGRSCGEAALAQARFELRRASLTVVPALFGSESEDDHFDSRQSKSAGKSSDVRSSGFSQSLPTVPHV